MKKIDPEKFYTPIEFADLEMTNPSSPNTRRQMLLRHIREGVIEAKNLGGERKPRYVVQGKHLIEYMNRQMKPKAYDKK